MGRSLVTVAIPYRGGCPHRDAAWDYVRRRYDELGLEVVVGVCDGPWRKAVAVNNALRRATGDVVVIADADVWCDTTIDAVDEVLAGNPWSVPHSKVKRLTEQATAAVLAGGPLCGDLDERAYEGIEGGGIVVMHRDLWKQAPMDPRFVGWGQEDEAWGIALRTHGGRIRRLKGVLWHLWHPPQRRDSRGIGSEASLELFKRYVHQPDIVLNEARKALQEI